MSKIFRALKDDFFEELKEGKLRYILEFERKNRQSFIVEIRNNFLDLYFLGHTIEVKKKSSGYYLIASNKFRPDVSCKGIIENFGPNKWQVSFDNIKNLAQFENIMVEAISKIIVHKKGAISEGVSELNHFIDNRVIGEKGILIVDRQVVYPGNRECRIDLLGLKRTKGNNFTFSIIELKNRNNIDIRKVFSQVKRYIMLLNEPNIYTDFMMTYQKILSQKIELGLLRSIQCRIAPFNEVSKKDIMGVVILDNFNMRRDLKSNGLLNDAIKDWSKIGGSYEIKLFLKTNVLDTSFFMDLNDAEACLRRYRECMN